MTPIFDHPRTYPYSTVQMGDGSFSAQQKRRRNDPSNNVSYRFMRLCPGGGSTNLHMQWQGRRLWRLKNATPGFSKFYPILAATTIQAKADMLFIPSPAQSPRRGFAPKPSSVFLPNRDRRCGDKLAVQASLVFIQSSRQQPPRPELHRPLHSTKHWIHIHLIAPSITSSLDHSPALPPMSHVVSRPIDYEELWQHTVSDHFVYDHRQ